MMEYVSSVGEIWKQNMKNGSTVHTQSSSNDYILRKREKKFKP